MHDTYTYITQIPTTTGDDVLYKSTTARPKSSARQKGKARAVSRALSHSSSRISRLLETRSESLFNSLEDSDEDSWRRIDLPEVLLVDGIATLDSAPEHSALPIGFVAESPDLEDMSELISVRCIFSSHCAHLLTHHTGPYVLFSIEYD